MERISQPWTFLEKLAFKFSFTLLGLFMFFFNNGTFILLSLIYRFQTGILHQFIPWVGKNVLHLPYDIVTFSNGSGDTTYDYVLLLCVASLSIVITLIWVLVDRKTAKYNRLYYWLTVGVRFYVGLMLINYGLVKVIQLQFPAPSLSRMLTTYGESSPMGLAWTFLGFSKGYNLFMGIAELMAGLLLFRRTVTVGAIITLMTTANVMAVNYFYDVPVKIVSTALVVMCLFLLVPNMGRLFKLFFKGEAVVLKNLVTPVFSKKWQRITKYTFKYFLIAFMCLGGVFNVLFMNKTRGRDLPKSPLYGAYEVDTFIKNTDTLSGVAQNWEKWKILMLEGEHTGVIKMANGEVKKMVINTDTLKKQIAINYPDEPKNVQYLNYSFVNKNQIILKGKFYKDSIKVELTKKKLQLIERELNWINEHPYNK